MFHYYLPLAWHCSLMLSIMSFIKTWMQSLLCNLFKTSTDFWKNAFLSHKEVNNASSSLIEWTITHRCLLVCGPLVLVGCYQWEWYLFPLFYFWLWLRICRWNWRFDPKAQAFHNTNMFSFFFLFLIWNVFSFFKHVKFQVLISLHSVDNREIVCLNFPIWKKWD